MKQKLGWTTVAAFTATLVVGCGSSEVPVVTAPAFQAPPAQPLPKEKKRGGGPASSGNMGRDPGADS